MYEVPYIFAKIVSRTVSRTGGVDGARKGWPTSVAGLHLGPGCRLLGLMVCGNVCSGGSALHGSCYYCRIFSGLERVRRPR